MDQVVQHLRNLSFFSELSDAALQELASKLRQRRLAQGEVLFNKGDVGDALYIISDGWVKAFAVNAHGEEVVLNQFGPGESFGEMALLDQEPRSASVAALSAAEVLELNREAFMQVMAQNPSFALDIMRDLSSKLRFAATYIQKATDWSQHIAKGEYADVMGDIRTAQSDVAGQQTDDERAGALLTAFFSMIEGVKAREDELRQQVQQLQIEIDEARKSTMVAEITSTDYFQELQRKAREMRKKPKSE